MEVPFYKRRFEELQRCVSRVEALYAGKIIVEKRESSFESPKDLVLNFFRVSYELKEALKNDATTPFKGRQDKDIVESFCIQDQNLALALDIANQAKHVILNRRKSNKIIGKINTAVHLFSPDGRDRTELTIEIDGKKEDCLILIKNCFNSWTIFFNQYNLLEVFS